MSITRQGRGALKKDVVRCEDFEFFAAALLNYWVRADVNVSSIADRISTDDATFMQLKAGLGDV